MAFTRNILKSSKFCNLFDFKTISNNGFIQTSQFLISVRTTKHWDPKWKWLRAKKVLPVDLPDYSKPSKEKTRAFLKGRGILPNRFWRGRPLTVTSLGEIFEPYVPPTGDGKYSEVSQKAKSLKDSLLNKKETFMAIRKIKSYDRTFDTKIFPQQAHDLYVEAHTVLMEKDCEKLSNYVTEKANADMLDDLKYKTLRWKFVESLEPPVVVHVRATPCVTKTNYFAQVTVRFHTKQILAIYDKFGRLFCGSEVVPKDVLEYVVFEKHIVNEYGAWRLHGKIIPEWFPVGEPSLRTYKVEEIEKDSKLDEVLHGYEDSEEDLPKTEIVKEDKEDSSMSVR